MGQARRRRVALIMPRGASCSGRLVYTITMPEQHASPKISRRKKTGGEFCCVPECDFRMNTHEGGYENTI